MNLSENPRSVGALPGLPGRSSRYGAYQDGSLGYPLFIDGEAVDRPVMITHGPVPMGALPGLPGGSSRYGAYRDGSLGAEAGQNVTPADVLNLDDPAVLAQFKAYVAGVLMGMFAGAPTPTWQDKLGPADFITSISSSNWVMSAWDDTTSAAWDKVVAGFTGLTIPTGNLPLSTDPATYGKGFPTAAGLAAMLTIAPAGVSGPALDSWLAAGAREINPPASYSPGMSTMTKAMVAGGVVVALGLLYMALRR